MTSLPPGLNLDSLPGPKRVVSPALYVRDESVPSPSGQYFALAYTINEVSMGNEIGCLLWGRITDGKAAILGNPRGVHATCWYSPWATWLDDQTFVFKAQHYDGERIHLPLVAIQINKGFAVLPGTENSESRPSAVTSLPERYAFASSEALLHAISGDA